MILDDLEISVGSDVDKDFGNTGVVGNDTADDDGTRKAQQDTFDDDDDGSGVKIIIDSGGNDDDDNDDDNYRKPTSDNDDDDNEISPQQFMFETLHKAGFLTDREKQEPLTEEEFNEILISELPSRALEALLETFPNNVQGLLKRAIHLGDSVNEEQLLEYFQVAKTIDNIPESFEKAEDARDYLRKNYISTGVHGEDDVDDVLDTLEDKGKLVSTAERVAKADKEEQIDKKKKAEEDAIKVANKRKEDNEKFINTIKTEIDSLKWTKEKKTSVIDNLNTQTMRQKNALITSNPKALIQLANIYSYFNVEKQEFDFTKLIAEMSENLDSKEKREALRNNSAMSRVSVGTRNSGTSGKGAKGSAVNDF